MITRFERPKPDDIDYAMVEMLEGVALRGWRQSLPDRTEAELRWQFNPDDYSHLHMVTAGYRKYAQKQGLLLAYGEDDQLIGFSQAGGEAVGNPGKQVWTKKFSPEKVVTHFRNYAHLRHICIDAAYQGQGNFRPLVAETLGAPGFTPDQVPAAYIFREHTIGRRAFSSIGFRMDPNPQVPKPLNGFFRSENHALQLRYTAPSIEIVQYGLQKHN